MENCTVNKNINNDFLSQSYSQGIERITGTKDSTFNFQIPKQLLQVREKTWDNLFDKYSKEMSDDIELNVDTLEPEEEEEEEEEAGSEEEYSCGQRVPMRKPATLVQYWINTGNPPYKVLLDENQLSETGSSLSEKEITSSVSLVTNVVNAVNNAAGDERKCKNDSSCSSVDTAAYILSNANITKKADTIAIIEGAKCVEVKSLKNVRVSSNDKIKYTEITRIDRGIRNNDGDGVNVNVPDVELHSMSTEYTASEIDDGAAASTLAPANAIQSDIYSQSLPREETDKIDKSNSQRNLDVQTIDDIASIFRQFDKTSKRLIEKNNDVSEQRDMALEMDTFHEKQVSENIVSEISAKDTNLTAFHRKKLYTGRDSPVDLILTETHGTSRLSRTRQSLHPALDPDGTIKKKTFLIHKNKRSLSAKKNFASKKVERKETRGQFDCISSKIIADSNDKYKYTNDNEIQDSNIDSSFKSSLSDLHDNSGRRDDRPFRSEYDDTNIYVKNEKYKQNLASLNLRPVVLLQRIEPSFERKFKFSKNTHKKNVVRNNKLEKLHSCDIENLALETVDSDESTILFCQCNTGTTSSRRVSSLSDCPLDLRSSIEDDFSASNAESKDGKPSRNFKDTDMIQNKELRVENTSSNKLKTCSRGKSIIDNVKLPEIKVILERLPLSMEKMQVLNKNAIWQQEISNKSKTHFSNQCGTNKKDNVKLREIRVLVERLSANVHLKESSNVTNTNIFPNKTNISQDTSLQTNDKPEPQIGKISKILTCENGSAAVRRPVRNDYSLRMSNSSSKKNNDQTSDTFDIVAERENQVFNKIESDSTFQRKTFRHKNRSSKLSRDRSKYSVLTFTSSDEDDFVRSIQHPRKRSKVSINDYVSGESNISEKNLCDRIKLVISDKSKYSRNSTSTVIRLSEKTVQKDVGSIKEKKEEHGGVVEIKSFGSNAQTATASLQTHKKRFVLFSSEDSNDNVDNLDKHKERISSFDSKKTINHNGKRRSNGAIKKNGIDRKDNVHVIFFQTKTFDTDSSDSEESDSYTSFACKALKSCSVYNRLRYHNRVNSEEIFNDSIAKRHGKTHLSSLNSSLENHNRMKSNTPDQNVRTKTRSNEDKRVISSKRKTNKESNSNIKSRRDASSSSLVNNNVQDTSVREKTFSNTFLEEINLDSLSENEEILDKSKNSVVVQQDHVTSAVRKLLTFQTKSYYDSSDSSETL